MQHVFITTYNNAVLEIRAQPLGKTLMVQTDLTQLQIVVDWWTTGDNWMVYHGGMNRNSKTTTMKKEQTWKKLSEQIVAAGITVARNA